MNRFVLFPVGIAGHPWRIARCAAAGIVMSNLTMPDESDSAAGAIAQELQGQAYRGEGILLAVPSTWCLCAQISTESLPRQKRHETLVYRLEEKLPVAAEALAADFIRHTHGATGICLLLEKAAALVKALEAKGVVIEAIVPAALLALQKVDSTGTDAVLWERAGRIEIFLLDKQLPVGWYSLPIACVLSPLVLGANVFNRALAVAGYGLSSETRSALKNPAIGSLSLHEENLEDAAANTATAILEGRLTPWINLRRDALAPPQALRAIKKPLFAAIAAVLLLCVCAGIMLLIRAAHYQSVAASLVAQQETVFHHALPTQATPLNVRSRLVSEVEKLTDLRGGPTKGDQRAPASALVLLRDAALAFPANFRFRITEMQVTPDHFYAEGQARSHSDAERLVQALDQTHHWNLEPPRTEQSANGSVTFTLTGAAVAPAGSVPGSLAR